VDTLVLDTDNASYLVNTAHLVRSQDDVSAEFAAATSTNSWEIDKSSPFVQWIGGDFVESDKANQNTQMWTAGDLELAEYSIKHAPLNMVHRWRQPIGFFAATRTIDLRRDENAAEDANLKIEALSGLWTHIFPFEAAQVEAAHDEGLLFYSMECRGTHINCAGENGCGETFKYDDQASMCEHLKERSSIRHIVNPTFRGGAIIVPPVKPGWKHANATILSDAVMNEAAAYAEQNEAQYTALAGEGRDLTPAGWEHLMASVLQQRQHVG
jgi:hypothetical protein